MKMEEERLRDAIKACETFALPSHDLDSEFHRFMTNWNQLKEEIAAQDESWKLFFIEEVNELVVRTHEIRLKFEEALQTQSALLSDESSSDSDCLKIDEADVLEEHIEMIVENQIEQSMSNEPNEPAGPTLNQSTPIPPPPDDNNSAETSGQASFPPPATETNQLVSSGNPTGLVNRSPNELNTGTTVNLNEQVISAASTTSANSSALSSVDEAPSPTLFSMEYVLETTMVLNLLKDLPKIPDVPRAEHIRRLREAITDALNRIRQCKGNFARIIYEPIVISFVIRAMSNDLKKFFRLQFFRQNVNLALVRDFLAQNEELIAEGFNFAENESATPAKRAKPTSNASTSANASSAQAGPSGIRASRGEAGASNAGAIPKTKRSKSKAKRQPKAIHYCFYCAEIHYMFRCPAFKALDFVEQMAYLDRRGICSNCLVGLHRAADCKKGGCLRCGVKHNSVLCPQNPRH